MSGILHVVMNDYRNDNRVRRAAEAGAALGQKTWVFSLHRAPLARWEWQRGVWTLRFALISRMLPRHKPVQLLKYLEAAMRMLRRGIILRPRLVHAHDVDALPIGWLIARVSGARLVYDAHELWCDPAHRGYLPAWIFRSMVGIERALARCASARITVSRRIARYLHAKLALPEPTVVRNTPERWPADGNRFLRRKLGIPAGAVVFLYQGAIDGEAVDLLLRAFRRLRGEAHLVFLGDGSAIPHLQASISASPPDAKPVWFHPAVPAAELPGFTADADVGVHPMTAGFLNHSWALPNKLFEYIQGGCAVIASRLPEMADILRQHGCGLVFTPGDEAGLADCLQRLLDDPGLRQRLRAAARIAAAELCWEQERFRLQELYARLGINSRAMDGSRNAAGAGP